VLNFASNFSAMIVFACGGAVLWAVSIPMALAQVAGGSLGAHLAIRRGVGFIRGVVLVVVVALVIKIARDVYLQNH